VLKRLSASIALFTVWLPMAPKAAQPLERHELSLPQIANQSSWKCSTQPIEPCVKRHGRLSSQNGIALKIWLIGTTRMVALENDVDDVPTSIAKYLDMTSDDHSYIFGDFDVCPVEPDVPGHIRRACVAGAEKLVVQPLRGSKPAFRLTSTWPR